MTDTPRNDGLPELPHSFARICDDGYWVARTPDTARFHIHDTRDGSAAQDVYSADQMRAYGEACRRASPSVGGVSEIVAELRNFADVMDGCDLTVTNAPTAMRAWADRLERAGSVGGVRVPHALSEHPRSSSYDQGWADGFTHCRSEVLRLNPAAEVGEVEELSADLARFDELQAGTTPGEIELDPEQSAAFIGSGGHADCGNNCNHFYVEMEPADAIMFASAVNLLRKHSALLRRLAGSGCAP